MYIGSNYDDYEVSKRGPSLTETLNLCIETSKKEQNTIDELNPKNNLNVYTKCPSLVLVQEIIYTFFWFQTLECLTKSIKYLVCNSVSLSTTLVTHSIVFFRYVDKLPTKRDPYSLIPVTEYAG